MSHTILQSSIRPCGQRLSSLPPSPSSCRYTPYCHQKKNTTKLSPQVLVPHTVKTLLDSHHTEHLSASHILARHFILLLSTSQSATLLPLPLKDSTEHKCILITHYLPLNQTFINLPSQMHTLLGLLMDVTLKMIKENTVQDTLQLVSTEKIFKAGSLPLANYAQ